VEEINALSDFNITVEPVRHGGQERGKLVGFHVQWQPKEPEEWQVVLRELGRSKIGRKARLRGQVETVATVL
jgi:hypothetical protein